MRAEHAPLHTTQLPPRAIRAYLRARRDTTITAHMRRPVSTVATPTARAASNATRGSRPTISTDRHTRQTVRYVPAPRTHANKLGCPHVCARICRSTHSNSCMHHSRVLLVPPRQLQRPVAKGVLRVNTRRTTRATRLPSGRTTAPTVLAAPLPIILTQSCVRLAVEASMLPVDRLSVKVAPRASTRHPTRPAGTYQFVL